MQTTVFINGHDHEVDVHIGAYRMDLVEVLMECNGWLNSEDARCFVRAFIAPVASGERSRLIRAALDFDGSYTDGKPTGLEATDAA